MNRRVLLAALVVFSVALALRIAHVVEYHRIVGLDVSRISQSDNHVFAEWARQIAAGDLLCREQPHAWHFWTRKVAPDAQWIHWYGGEKTFHQAPLYPYFLAAVFSLFGEDRLALGIVQALLGALTCLLTFVLGARVAGPRVGLVAGLLLALCAPYFFYDVFHLRDGPMALLVVLVALASERALRRSARRDWFLLGAGLGLFTLAKETGPALLVLAGVLAVWLHRGTPRRALAPLLLLGVGFLVPTSPAYVRNVVVGAPTFRLSTRGPEVFLAGNAAGQNGLTWDPPIELTRSILTETDFSLPGTVVKSVSTHRSRPTGYVELLWNKTCAFFAGEEIPNNVNFEQFRAHLSTLRLGFVTVTFLGPACLLGLLLGLRRRERLAAPYLLFLALTASVVALYVLGRFRLQVLPLMALFSAVAVDEAIALARRRSAALVPLLIGFGLLVWAAWPRPSVFTAENRHAAFMMMHVVTDDLERARRFRRDHQAAIAHLDPASMSVEQRRFLDALDTAFERYDEAHAYGGAERMLRLGRAYADYVEATGGFLQGLMHERALECLEEARRLDDTLAGPDYETGRIHRAMGDRDAAVLRFVRELHYDPGHAPSHRGIGLILFDLERRDACVRHLETAIRGGEVDALLLATSALVRGSPSHKEQVVPLVGGEMLQVYDPLLALERARTARGLAEPTDIEVRRRVALALYAAGRGLGDVAALEEAKQVFLLLLDVAPERAEEWQRLTGVVDDTLAALHSSPR